MNSKHKRVRSAILLGHGSSQGSDSSRPVRYQAELLRRRGAFDEVLVAFWKEEPFIRQILDFARGEDIFIVPYLMSQGYFSEEVFPRELGMKERVEFRGERRVVYGDAVGTHPSMTQAIRDCILTTLIESGFEGAVFRDFAVVIVGHGTERHAGSAKSVQQHVELLRKQGCFAEVLDAYLDEPPYDREILQRVRTSRVVVVPFLVSDGHHSREDIPVHMGLVRKGEVLTNPMNGPFWGAASIHQVWYGHAVGEGPWMEPVVWERFQELVNPVSSLPSC